MTGATPTDEGELMTNTPMDVLVAGYHDIDAAHKDFDALARRSPEASGTAQQLGIVSTSAATSGHSGDGACRSPNREGRCLVSSGTTTSESARLTRLRDPVPDPVLR